MNTQLMRISTVVALSALISTQALAQQARGGKSYAGIQLTQTQTEYNVGAKFSIPVASIRLGYHINDYFSMEGRLGVPIGDDTDKVNINNVAYQATLSPDYMWGLYGVAHLDVTDKFSFYAVAGYTKARTDIKVSGGLLPEPLRDDDDDDGFSGGGGIEFAITPSLTLSLEYVSYLRNKGYDVSGYSLGIQTDF